MSTAAVTVIGGVQVDVVIVPVSDLPAPGQTALVEEMSFRSGGAGSNTALALVAAGTSVRLVGCVADDNLGRWLRDDLGRLGLAGEIAVVEGRTTGLTVACEAPGRDRSFLTYLGVNEVWDEALIPPDAVESRSLLMCDYFCAPSLRGAPTARLLSAARDAGARTFFDTAWDSSGWSEQTRAEVLALLDRVDVFLPNEAEARALTGSAEPPERLARALQEISGGWVVVKLGERGAFAAGPGGAEHEVAAEPARVLDSTGAGDAFNAGLIAALDGGDDWPQALHAATALAAATIARPVDERHLPLDATTGGSR
jgi:sugar/nucleoside kinase (ribokinase family)